MKHVLLAAVAFMIASVANAAPSVVTSAIAGNGVRHTITFDATTAASGVITRTGLCQAVSFSRAGSETVSLFQTNAATATAGTLVDTFAATTSIPEKLGIAQARFYVSSDGATAGGVLTVECFPMSASILGVRGGRASETVTIPTTGNPWIACDGLPDPGYTPVSVTAADDLHQVVIDECATGCELVLAAGTYADTNVTLGPTSGGGADAIVKAGSLDAATGEIIIRAADPDNPPVLEAEPGNPAAIFYIVDIAARFRFKDLILDGKKSKQTNAIFVDRDGNSTICADTTPENGVCDSGTLTVTEAGGINIRSRIGADMRLCADNVTVRNTVFDAFFMRNTLASTVQNSTVRDAGCTSETCPLIDVPDNAENTNLLVSGRGINFVASEFSGISNNDVSGVTKMGLQCFGSDACYIADNVVTDGANGGITMLGSSGYVWRNSIDRVGTLYGQNSSVTNTGNGIDFVDDTLYSGDLLVEIIGNAVRNTFGASIAIGLRKVPAAESSTLIVNDNTSSGSCLVSTLSSNAAILIGDGTDRLESVSASGNTVTDSDCPVGLRVRNVIAYEADTNSISGFSGGTAVAYDDVEALDETDITVDGSISIDADSVGTLADCTLNDGATIIGALEGGVTRTNCGPAHSGGGSSSNWGELEWGADDWG